MNMDDVHADTVQNASDEGREHQPAPDAQDLETALSQETSSPIAADAHGIHETLLEGVSTDALVASGVAQTEAGQHSDTDGAAAAAASEAGSAPLADDLTVVPEEAAAPVPGAAEAVEAVVTAAETVAQVVPETIAASLPVAETGPAAGDRPVTAAMRIALPDFGTALDLTKSPRIAEVMDELGAVNATVLTYLRGEGTAALAHWQALSGARTPADAIRIQVDEMQRAADASLSCFAALANRASQFTAGIGGRA